MTDKRCPFHQSLPQDDAHIAECPVTLEVEHSERRLQSWARTQVRQLLQPLLTQYESRSFRHAPPYEKELIDTAHRLVHQLITEAAALQQPTTVAELRERYVNVCADLQIEASAQNLSAHYQSLLHHGKWGENLFGWLTHAVHVACDLLPKSPLQKHKWQGYRARLLGACQGLAYFPLQLEGFALSNASACPDGSQIAHTSILPILRSICQAGEVSQMSSDDIQAFSLWLPRSHTDTQRWPATRHGCPALRSPALMMIVDAICDDYETLTYGEKLTLQSQ